MSDTNIPTVVVEREIGGRTFRVETGEVARLAGGAVMVTYGESVVLTTAVRANPRPGLDFFPLQCDYREKMSAAGKYPGGFRKREGAPSEREILTMRNCGPAHPSAVPRRVHRRGANPVLCDEPRR